MVATEGVVRAGMGLRAREAESGRERERGREGDKERAEKATPDERVNERMN